MEKIAIKYVSGRPIGKLYFNRKRYVFNKENNFTCEVPLEAWELVQQSNVFVPATVKEITTKEEVTETTDLTCECGFTAKTINGLNTHRVKSIKHKGE